MNINLVVISLQYKYKLGQNDVQQTNREPTWRVNWILSFRGEYREKGQASYKQDMLTAQGGDKMQIEVRKYQIKNAKLRNNVNFKTYKKFIRDLFKEVTGGKVKVLFACDYYLVIGSITKGELIRVGQKINKNPTFGRLCKKSSTGTQLVTRVGFLTFTEEEFENIYHFYEGAITDGRKAKEQ